ncbi:MAG: FecR domain-containing protein, partial [Aquincola sp.]|nr:FecR domain-containing protein [Aquincola sp.]
ATMAAWALAAAMAGPLAAAPTGEHVALFKSVSGSVTVVRSSGPVTATAGMPLYVADRLVSAADATAGIMFKDGTAVTLGPASKIELRDYVFEPKDARYQFDLYLSRGKAVYASGKIGKLSPESVKVGTPTATVGVRGTRFIVEAE